MILLNIKQKQKTIILKLTDVKIQKRFYPQVNVTSNAVTQGVKVLLPRIKPSFSSSLPGAIMNIPRSTTILSQTFPLPKILYHKSYKTINQNSLNENPILENALSTLMKSKKPFSDKPQSLKTFTNKNYETYITPNTIINDLTEEQLKEELKKRELIKIDEGKTATTILLQDDSKHILGLSKHGIKLSSLGQAYFENYSIQNNNKSVTKIPKDFVFNMSNVHIIVPPESSSDLFIETGKQKHLLVIVDDQGNFFSFGYLTSKLSGHIISDKQVKAFQDQQESMHTNTQIKTSQDQQEHNPGVNEKKQAIVFFDNFVKINKNDIKYVKWDKEYLNTVSKNNEVNLRLMFDKKKINPITIFNKDGITKKELLHICKEHDRIAMQKKPKHPLSKDQIKQNEHNKIKQQNNIGNDEKHS